MFFTIPHSTPAQVLDFASGTHAQTLGGPPAHVSPAAHGVQRVTSPQPCVLSVGTHVPEHALVPGPQLPSTHEEPLHTTVPPAPGEGQLDASHVVGPQP